MILNRQRELRVPGPSLSRFLARAKKSVRMQRAGVTVCLVSDAEITRLNRTYRGQAKPTDVLSFRAAAPAADGRSRGPHGATMWRGIGDYLGDIAISPAVARRNARTYGRSLQQELRILILHGLLHLMGYDHETDDGQMARYERRLRRRLGLIVP